MTSQSGIRAFALTTATLVIATLSRSIMGVPLLLIAFPPLLVLYPTSYAIALLRTLFPRRVRGAKLLSDGRLTDPRKPHREHNDPSYAAAAAATPLVERVGDGKLLYPEDVLIWERNRVAIFSCDPGRPQYDPFKNELADATTFGDVLSGELMLYDLDSREVTKLEIADWPTARTLHPLGVGIRDSGESAVLAVANIGEHFAAVEVLRLSHDGGVSAQYLHSLENPWLTTPNAVVPLSEESVLVTNSFGFSPLNHRILASLELLLAAPLGSVLHLSRGEYITREEKAKADTVASHIALANGLALSDDGRVLLVAGCTSNNVHVYDINPGITDGCTFDSEHASYRETIPVGFSIDNLRFHADNGEYVFLGAGHPSGLAYMAAQSSKGAKFAPSRVVTITIAKKDSVKSSVVGNVSSWLGKMFTAVDPRVRTIFEDDGQLLTTAATAVAFTGKSGGSEMLVTGLWEARGPVHCIEVDI